MSNISLEELDRKVKALSGETQDLKQDLASIRNGSANRLGGLSARFDEPDAMAGAAAPSRGIGVAVLAAVLSAAACAGVVWLVAQNMVQARMAEVQKEAAVTAKQAVRSAMHGLKTYVQLGKFNSKNQVPGGAVAFDWALKTPVDPEHVVSILPEIVNPPVPVLISAEITEGGKKCRMTVTGDTAKLLEKLSSGLDAKVTIMLDADQLGSLEHK
jgi:hypothetical protein